MVLDHCAAELPQGWDHSSPASFQSYFVEWLCIFPWPKTWLGPESNRRHVDFQSTALPTELPSLLAIRISNFSGAPKLYLGAMKRPTLRVLEYRHSKTHPWYLDLRPFNRGRKFFKTKAEAERLADCLVFLKKHPFDAG
jgi:hypothetical protein